MRRLVKSGAACAVLVLVAVVGCGGGTAADLVAKGKRELAQGDPAAATIQLKAALQLDPQSAEARYLLGLVLLDDGQPGAAVTEFQKSAELNHSREDVLPALARALLLSGQYKKVIGAYDKAELQGARPSADLRTSVASAWAASGDRQRTEAALADALKFDPSFAPALLLQARLMAASGKFDEALRTVEAVLGREQGNHEAWFLKGELLQIFKQDQGGVLESYKRALAAHKTHFPAHRAVIGLMMRRGDLAGMEAQVAQLRSAAPTHAYTTFSEAQLAYLKADYARAKPLVQAILKVAPDNSSALHLAGAIEYQDGSLLIAKNHLTKAVQTNPRLLSARKLLARVELRLGQPAAALAALQPLFDASAVDADSAALAGDAELQLGHPAKAEAHFSKAVASSPNDPRFRTAMAMSQLARGDADAAFTELQSIAAEDKGAVADLALISTRLRRGEIPAALAAADALVGKQPQSAMALTTRGRIHAGARNLAKSRADLEKALGIDPKYFPAALALAEVDIAEGKPQEARTLFERQLQVDPANYRASLAAADLAAKSGGTLEEVVKILAEGIKNAPTAPPLRMALVNAYLSKRNATRALEVAQQANAAMPGQPELVESLGNAQLASGQMQQALSSFRQLANLTPRSAEPHLRIANTYLAMGDRPSGERSLRAALDLNPKLEIAQRRLMQLALADNRPRDALAVARAMQKQDPKDPLGYIFESDLLLKLKDLKGAKSVLRTGLKQAGSSTIAQRLHMHLHAGAASEAGKFAAEWERSNPADTAFDFYLSGVASRAGDLAQAEKRLRRVLSIQPQHADALNNLAWLLLNRGDKDALPMAQRANQLVPDRPAYMDTLASALAADGQTAKALELQNKAIENAPDFYALRLTLAKIAIRAGDKALAKGELEKLARLGGRFASQAEVTKLMHAL